VSEIDDEELMNLSIDISVSSKEKIPEEEEKKD
jgi:hypothetical protein